MYDYVICKSEVLCNDTNKLILLVMTLSEFINSMSHCNWNVIRSLKHEYIDTQRKRISNFARFLLEYQLKYKMQPTTI